MTPPLHILAAMGLVWHEKRVLMIKSARGEWECPGGQVEVGEDPVVGLHREVYEETGCGISVTSLAAINTNCGAAPYPILMLDYVARYHTGILKTSEESVEVEWMTPDQAVAAVTHPSMAARLSHLLSFDGRIRRFTYKLDPFKIVADVMEDR